MLRLVAEGGIMIDIMIREGYIPYLGHRTYYRIAGDPSYSKTPLLLLHGGPGSAHNYFEVLDRLADQEERQIVSYDQIGCGNSFLEGRPDLWVMETWIGELEEIRKQLSLPEVILLGQSWGGMLLLEYVTKYAPEGVKGIVLSSTLPSSRLWEMEQRRMIEELPKAHRDAIEDAWRRNDYTSPEYKKAEDAYMLLHCAGPYGEGDPECLTRPKKTGRESYVTAWGPNEFTPQGTLKDFDVTEKLPDIDLPTLIISGGRDLCTPFIAKTMHDAIPGSRWELLRTCRHTCFVEDTERYVSILRDWMREKGL